MGNGLTHPIPAAGERHANLGESDNIDAAPGHHPQNLSQGEESSGSGGNNVQIPTVNTEDYNLMFGGPPISFGRIYGEQPTLFFFQRRSDPPPPPPPDLRPTLTIKNDLNLLKRTLKLIPVNTNPTGDKKSSSQKYVLEFYFDTRVPCQVFIYFASSERRDKKTNTSVFITEKNQPFLLKSPIPPQIFPTPGIGQKYILPIEYAIDLSKCKLSDMEYNEESNPHKYPLVIELRSLPSNVKTNNSDALSSVQNTKSTKISPPSSSSSSSSVSSNEKLKYQFTYGSIIAQSDGGYTIKPLKQKIQVDGQCYELADIFGIEKKGSKTSTSVTTKASQELSEGGVLNETTIQQSPYNSSSTKNEVNNQIDAQINGGGSDDNDDDDDEHNLCVICIAEPSDTAVIPCRHMCLCFDCAKMLRLQTNKCPICRAVVHSIIQIPTRKKECERTGTSAAIETGATSIAKKVGSEGQKGKKTLSLEERPAE